MSASLRLRVGVAAAGLSCLLLSYAAAQQVQSTDQTRSNRLGAGAAGQSGRSTAQQADRPTLQRRTANYRGAQANAAGHGQVIDRFFAGCLLAQNESEVQLSEIAQQKAENPQVKQFAQKMIEDHRKMIEQLQPLAGTSGERNRTSENRALPGTSGASDTVQASGTTAGAPGAPAIGTPNELANEGATAGATASSGVVHQLMQIDRQINEKCTQAAKDELQQKTGAEFDKCYVGSAISAHMHALAALEVIGQQTQGQLAQVAQQAEPTVKQHLEHAK
jgi:predicted outer membrane protein